MDHADNYNNAYVTVIHTQENATYNPAQFC